MENLYLSNFGLFVALVGIPAIVLLVIFLLIVAVKRDFSWHRLFDVFSLFHMSVGSGLFFFSVDLFFERQLGGFWLALYSVWMVAAGVFSLFWLCRILERDYEII